MHKNETLIVWVFTPKNHKRQLHDLPILVFTNRDELSAFWEIWSCPIKLRLLFPRDFWWIIHNIMLLGYRLWSKDFFLWYKEKERFKNLYSPPYWIFFHDYAQEKQYKHLFSLLFLSVVLSICFDANAFYRYSDR